MWNKSFYPLHNPWIPPCVLPAHFCHLRQSSGCAVLLAESENCHGSVCFPSLAKKAVLPAVFISSNLSAQLEVWHPHTPCGRALGILLMICAQSKLLTQNMQTGFSWHPNNCQYFPLEMIFLLKVFLLFLSSHALTKTNQNEGRNST